MPERSRSRALELQQEFVGVRGDAAQFVESGVVACGDDVALAQHHGGLLGDGPVQDVRDIAVFADGVRELGDQRRFDSLQRGAQRGQRRERRAQRGEIARPCAAQRDARQDALHVADGAQRFAQALEAARVDQQRQRLVTAAQFLLVGERTVQPAPQLARAHGRAGRIQQREQRRRVLSR